MATRDTVGAELELISLDRAREEVDGGAKLIDVREQNEWDESHIEAAIHVAQGELAERIDEIAPDTSQRIILYCRSGARSAMTTQAFRASGFQAFNLTGGLLAWVDKGLPIVPDDGTVADH